MKSIISFLFCCQVIYITYGQNCSLSGDLSILQTVRPCYAGSWVLEFEDNFAGGELDLDKWRPLYNYGQKDELAYMTPNNHVFASHSANLINSAYGVLKLESKVKSIGGRSFSSGMIESKGLFGYGKYEIRCKIPSGNGHWPAFWIFGHNTPWEEVDFFEFNFSRKDNENDKVHTALHYSSPTAPSGEEGCGGVWSDGTDYSASFHTFTTIYGPTQTDWFVDGVLISTVVRWYNILGQAVPCKNLIVPQLYSQNLAYPKGAPSNIIINSTIGNENADLPNTFEIDYVRFYSQPTYCGGQAVLVNPTGGAMGCIDWNHPEITVKNN
jgi:beta-glucanase (GH16 family)